MKTYKSTASGTEITNDTGSTRFKCFECGNEIIRTHQERKLGTKYKCSQCGFEGPN